MKQVDWNFAERCGICGAPMFYREDDAEGVHGVYCGKKEEHFPREVPTTACPFCTEDLETELEVAEDGSPAGLVRACVNKKCGFHFRIRGEAPASGKAWAACSSPRCRCAEGGPHTQPTREGRALADEDVEDLLVVLESTMDDVPEDDPSSGCCPEDGDFDYIDILGGDVGDGDLCAAGYPAR